MRILTYNILEGGIGRIDPLAEVIRLANADIAILQETWDPDLFHKLADRLHMDRFLAENPKNPQGATGLLSRLPISQAINHAPLDPRLTRSAFSASIEFQVSSVEFQDASSRNSTLETRNFSLMGLHLHARETLADEAIRLTELPAILDIASSLPHPLLIAGDFNTSHPDQPLDLAKLRQKSRDRLAAQSNQLPREVIRKMLAAGYIDAHSLHRTPDQFDTSFPTSLPALRIDFLFITPDLIPLVNSCEVFKPEIARFASDHFPVLLDLKSAMPSSHVPE